MSDPVSSEPTTPLPTSGSARSASAPWQVAQGLKDLVGADRSLFIFGRDHAVRRAALHVTRHPWFENLVMLVILGNIICMAADDPLCDAASCHARKGCCRQMQVLGSAEYIFTALFTAECLLRTIATNFFFGPEAYLQTAWSWLDFGCVLISLVSLAPVTGGSQSLSSLRALRALRPLRTIQSIPGMRKLVQTLLDSLPLLVDVIVLLAWLFCVFGIVALQLFMGQLRGRCVEHTGSSAPWQIRKGLELQVCKLPGNQGGYRCPAGTTCREISVNQMADKYSTSYDTFVWVCLAIFQTLTLDNWVDDQLRPLVDAVGFASTVPYFVLLVLFGTYFAMQLLVAIISSKFAQLDVSQPSPRPVRRLWSMQSIRSSFKAVRSTSVLQPVVRLATRAAAAVRAAWQHPLTQAHELPAARRWARLLTESRPFHYLIMLMIVVNTGVMSMTHYGMPERMAHVDERISSALTAGFAVEMLLKHISLGAVGYWRIGFNMLDGAIVLTSVTELFINIMHNSGSRSGISALRALRLLRVLRSMKLLSHISSLRKLANMIFKGFAALKDFMMLLALFLLIFAILGTKIFGGSPAFSPEAAPEDYRSNFNSLWQSGYTVFQLLTGSDWVRVMRVGMKAKGAPAAFYFIVWHVVGNFVLLTLFLAILITNFTMDESLQRPQLEVQDPVIMGSALDEAIREENISRHFKQRVRETAGVVSLQQVHNVRKWLVCMGMHHGLSPGEVLSLQRELVEDYNAGRGLTWHAPIESEDTKLVREDMLFRYVAMQKAAVQEDPVPMLPEWSLDWAATQCAIAVAVACAADAMGLPGASELAGGRRVQLDEIGEVLGRPGAAGRKGGAIGRLQQRVLRAVHGEAHAVDAVLEDVERSTLSGFFDGRAAAARRTGQPLAASRPLGEKIKDALIHRSQKPGAGTGAGGSGSIKAAGDWLSVAARTKSLSAVFERSSLHKLWNSAGRRDHRTSPATRLPELRPVAPLQDDPGPQASSSARPALHTVRLLGTAALPGRALLQQAMMPALQLGSDHEPALAGGYMMRDPRSRGVAATAAATAADGAEEGADAWLHLRPATSVPSELQASRRRTVECPAAAGSSSRELAAAGSSRELAAAAAAGGERPGRAAGMAAEERPPGLQLEACCSVSDFSSSSDDAEPAPHAVMTLNTRVRGTHGGIHGPESLSSGTNFISTRAEPLLGQWLHPAHGSDAHGTVVARGFGGCTAVDDAEEDMMAEEEAIAWGLLQYYKRSQSCPDDCIARTRSSITGSEAHVGHAHPAEHAAGLPDQAQGQQVLQPAAMPCEDLGPAAGAAAAGPREPAAVGALAAAAARSQLPLWPEDMPALWPHAAASGLAVDVPAASSRTLTPRQDPLLGSPITGSQSLLPLPPVQQIPHEHPDPLVTPTLSQHNRSPASLQDPEDHSQDLNAAMSSPTPSCSRAQPLAEASEWPLFTSRSSNSPTITPQPWSPETTHCSILPQQQYLPLQQPRPPQPGAPAHECRISQSGAQAAASGATPAQAVVLAVLQRRMRELEQRRAAPAGQAAAAAELRAAGSRMQRGTVGEGTDADGVTSRGAAAGLAGQVARERGVQQLRALADRGLAPSNLPGLVSQLRWLVRLQGLPVPAVGQGGFSMAAAEAAQQLRPFVAHAAASMVVQVGASCCGGYDADGGPRASAATGYGSTVGNAGDANDWVLGWDARSGGIGSGPGGPVGEGDESWEEVTGGIGGGAGGGMELAACDVSRESSESGRQLTDGAGPGRGSGHHVQWLDSAGGQPWSAAGDGAGDELAPLVIQALREYSQNSRGSSFKHHGWFWGAIPDSVMAERTLTPESSAGDGDGQSEAEGRGSCSPPGSPKQPARQLSHAAEDGSGSNVTGRSRNMRKANSHMAHTSCFLLGPRNPLRTALNDLQQAPAFEMASLALIAASALVLALDSPSIDPRSACARIMARADLAFTFVFTAEMAIKLLAKGVILHPGAYLRNFWDTLDGLIVTTSLVAFLPISSSTSLQPLRALRLLRALRPLRAISRLDSMQLVVETLIQCLPSVASVVLFGILEFCLFGILGVQLFSGAFHSCNDASVRHRSECAGTFTCGLTPGDRCPAALAALPARSPVPRQWQNPFLSFDHIGRAMLTLFVTSTLDRWVSVVYACMDAVSPAHQPVTDHSPAMGLYIVAFVFLGSFFWVNLMVSVVIDHYTQLISQRGGAAMVTSAQREWTRLFKLHDVRQDRWKGTSAPDGYLRGLAFRICSHNRFEALIMATIALNTTAMAAEHYQASAAFHKVSSAINILCTAVFIAEAALKLLALGVRSYFGDNWNKLDMFIVLASIPDLTGKVSHGTKFVTALRMFRICRLFKVVQSARGLRTLFNTLLSSLPAIINVGSLLFLLMFAYAVMGMNLFGSEEGIGLHSRKFRNFWTSLLTLFQVFTGDGWSDLMAETSGCDDFGYSCTTGLGATVSILYFTSFVVLGSFIMLNLVIAVILDKFVEAARDEGLLKTNRFMELLRAKVVLGRFASLLKAAFVRQRRADRRVAAWKAPSLRYGSRRFPKLPSPARSLRAFRASTSKHLSYDPAPAPTTPISPSADSPPTPPTTATTTAPHGPRLTADSLPASPSRGSSSWSRVPRSISGKPQATPTQQVQVPSRHVLRSLLSLPAAFRLPKQLASARSPAGFVTADGSGGSGLDLRGGTSSGGVDGSSGRCDASLPGGRSGRCAMEGAGSSGSDGTAGSSTAGTGSSHIDEAAGPSSSHTAAASSHLQRSASLSSSQAAAPPGGRPFAAAECARDGLPSASLAAAEERFIWQPK